MPPPSTPQPFQRVIGVRPLALTMVNLIVGAGIFGLPAFAAHDLGPAAVLAYGVCIVLVGLVGLCLAEAGSRVSDAGGVYAYASASFGPYVGAITGHLLWFANGAVGNAAVAVLGADTLGMLVPWLAGPVPRAAVSLRLIRCRWSQSTCEGRAKGSTSSQITTVLKLLPLVGLVVLGLPHVHAANLRFHELPSASALGRTSVLLFFAFMGFESGLNTSGEVTAPARTVPRAILIALTLVGALYLGLQVVAQGVLGSALGLAGDAPLGATARASFGPIGATVVLVATVLSTAGVLAGDALGTPRVMNALGRDGVLPTIARPSRRDAPNPGARDRSVCAPLRRPRAVRNVSDPRDAQRVGHAVHFTPRLTVQGCCDCAREGCVGSGRRSSYPGDRW